MSDWLAKHAWLATWITLALAFIIIALIAGSR